MRPRTFPAARKRFGQHFLEPAWVARIVDAMEPLPDQTFLEIGPGRGAMTRPLAERAARVIAVEIDRDLAAALPLTLPPNVRVVQADFLDLDLAGLLHDEALPIRVVANLPYNVATPILFRILHEAGDGRVLSDATLMLQREVADRLLAGPGTSDYGALTIQVRLLADVSPVLKLPPGAFRPAPKVHSAVVKLRFRPPAVDVGDRAAFERLVRGLFLQRRKTLLNALKPVADAFGSLAPEVIERAGVDGRRRPETLSLEEMARLTRCAIVFAGNH
ncbi:MAG TPA: 16S rRNA (adenine(1518)-N(6)/adenine(1519)-N(6))-dimethyltransferase RsmA [Vicinamibacterales bacterium]|nr:16S rRNA (adenine(1518)-N(6)/adenine(1519)-N(6))-dimethyltransferase RsmA [Vicinamibacterales bacterium]